MHAQTWHTHRHALLTRSNCDCSAKFAFRSAQEIDIHEPKRNLRSAGFTEVCRPRHSDRQCDITALGCTANFNKERRLVQARPESVPSKRSSQYAAHVGPVQEERQSFTACYTEAGMVDAFREQHPGIVAYTYFSHRMGMRAKGKGWRLDYFLVSRQLRLIRALLIQQPAACIFHQLFVNRCMHMSSFE